MKHQAESINYWTSDKIGVFDPRRRHLAESLTGSAFSERTWPILSLLEGLVAVVLLAQGFAKLLGSPVVSPLFDQNGISWLRSIVGVVEVAFALLLLNPRPRLLESFMMREPDQRSSPLPDSDDRTQGAPQGDPSHVL